LQRHAALLSRERGSTVEERFDSLQWRGVGKKNEQYYSVPVSSYTHFSSGQALSKMNKRDCLCLAALAAKQTDQGLGAAHATDEKEQPPLI
jgi:hypothetical protein